MNSTTYITLDLQAPNLAVVASAKQNDTRGRQIAATLRDGSASFDATGLLCEIRYAKPDGTVGFYDTLEDNTTPAYTIDGNVVTFTLAEQMLTVAGAVYVDLNFYAATGEKLTAFAFCLQVEASVLDDGTIVSSDYYNVLTATLAEAAEIAANLPQPSSDTPVADSASGSAGTGNGFARGNHSHPLNVATSGTPSFDGTGANGTSDKYARQDHVHPLNVPTSGTPADLGTPSNGTATKYARADHVHKLPALRVVSTITELPATISDAAITATMQVVEATFGTPSAILSDISWSAAAGSITLSGTLGATSTTTVTLLLVDMGGSTAASGVVPIPSSAVSSTLAAFMGLFSFSNAESVLFGVSASSPYQPYLRWTHDNTLYQIRISDSGISYERKVGTGNWTTVWSNH